MTNETVTIGSKQIPLVVPKGDLIIAGRKLGGKYYRAPLTPIYAWKLLNSSSYSPEYDLPSTATKAGDPNATQVMYLAVQKDVIFQYLSNEPLRMLKLAANSTSFSSSDIMAAFSAGVAKPTAVGVEQDKAAFIYERGDGVRLALFSTVSGTKLFDTVLWNSSAGAYSYLDAKYIPERRTIIFLMGTNSHSSQWHRIGVVKLNADFAGIENVFHYGFKADIGFAFGTFNIRRGNLAILRDAGSVIHVALTTTLAVSTNNNAAAYLNIASIDVSAQAISVGAGMSVGVSLPQFGSAMNTASVVAKREGVSDQINFMFVNGASSARIQVRSVNFSTLATTVVADKNIAAVRSGTTVGNGFMGPCWARGNFFTLKVYANEEVDIDATDAAFANPTLPRFVSSLYRSGQLVPLPGTNKCLHLAWNGKFQVLEDKQA